MNQNEKLVAYMAEDRGITRLEAMFSFGIQNITARIQELRDRHAIDVVSTIKVDPQRRRYAEYTLAPGERRFLLATGELIELPGGRYRASLN